ncbi:MAG: Crp/Fnr family transcriptional regulator [Sphingomonas sp.]|uniref:Crp/Fnr family transcriptional regulator n=1 Tax=Sphingomonas sp. TaxID=28214 RepID=UPI001AC5355B|nr:Crp/Fnr family transcriptional regulator [Sphingomonas sp.]MBN8808249.1 Crp/Fnr family transcriptional regulator [Sphingomonas sp.]
MTALPAPRDDAPPALRRIAALAPLTQAAKAALADAIGRALRVPARRELLTEGKPITEMRMIVSGWAARARILPDGQRQFMSFLFPGDLIGYCRQPAPLAVSTVVALTDLTVCTPPAEGDHPSLCTAYTISAAIEEAYLLANITRLGRMSAQERIYDLFLEFHERLALAGLAVGGAFELPLTQEMLGDALGLTSVHVNRMIQAARRDGDIEWRGGHLKLRHPRELARRLGRHPTRISAEQ